MDDLQRTLVFLIHSVKQFLFGFEKLIEAADECEDGSAAKAFYMTSFYNYVSVFYLLDKKAGDLHGGTIYKALHPHGLDGHLTPITNILTRPIGSTTFGEIVRTVRNKMIVHTTYSDSDLDRIYSAADMAHPTIAQSFHECLWDLYHETRLLPVRLIEDMGLSPADFGITIAPEDTR